MSSGVREEAGAGVRLELRGLPAVSSGVREEAGAGVRLELRGLPAVNSGVREEAGAGVRLELRGLPAVIRLAARRQVLGSVWNYEGFLQ